MRKLSLRRKFFLCFASVVLLTAILGGIGIGNALRIKNTATYSSQNSSQSIKQLTKIRVLTYTFRQLSIDSTTEDKLSQVKLLDNSKYSYLNAQQTLKQSVDQYLLNTQQTTQQFPLAQEMASVCRALIISGQRAVESDDILKHQQNLANLINQTERLINLTDLALEHELLALQGRRDLLTAVIKQSFWTLSLTVLSVLVVSAILASYLTAHLTQPILEAVKAAQAIGAGRFDYRLTINSSDELGDLARAFNQMSEQLKSTTISWEYLDNALQSMTDLVLLTDGDRKIELINKAVSLKTGFNKAELIGSAVDNIFCEPIQGLFANTHAGKELDQATNRLVLCKTSWQGTFPALLAITRLHNHNESTGFIFVLRDISEQIKKEQELELTRQRLDYAERMASLGTLGSILAHRLNQPLTALKLFLQQILQFFDQQKHENAMVGENIHECLKAADNISAVMKNFIDNTKDNGEEKQIFDLSKTINHVLNILAPDADRGCVKLLREGLQLDCPFYGTQIEMEELFYIVLKNGLQALSSSTGVVKVSLSRIADKYQIVISDNGPGIAAEHIDRIFNLYFTTKGSNGSGLGLCIARQIVTNHGGNLSFESKAGVGTTIRIDLPRSKEEPDV